MDQRHKDILDHGRQLFSKSGNLLTLWQEIADNFYPERGDFTISRSLGDEFASHLDTSYPIMARRDLGNAFGAMLRPPEKDWFKITTKNQETEDEAGRKFLEQMTKVQKRAMYDRESGFVRATKEGDHDFAAFGQAVLSSELATTPDTGQILLHRCWHLRDVRWCENHYGKISQVHRNWKPAAKQLAGMFPKTVHPDVKLMQEKEPFREINVRHVVISAHDYDFGKNYRFPHVSIYMDVDHDHLLEEVGSWNPRYVIPRWSTVSGSQYAYSPAAIAALPDARLIQAMTYTLLTAGEKAVDPPLIGIPELIKGPIEMMPGGFTARDADYDERLGEVIRPIQTGGEKSIPLGLEMTQDARRMIAEAFFLNRLTMPPAQGREMTAYEVAQRIEEFIRQALPLFEPMETDYNGALCELDFDILLRAGAFGPPDAIPQSLRKKEIEFRFESPLRDAADRLKGQRFMEAKALMVEAAPLDPLAVQMVDARVALRDALRGIGTPAKWMRDEADLEDMEEQARQAKAAEGLLQTVSAGAQVAEQVGKAGIAIKEAGRGQEGAVGRAA